MHRHILYIYIPKKKVKQGRMGLKCIHEHNIALKSCIGLKLMAVNPNIAVIDFVE